MRNIKMKSLFVIMLITALLRIPTWSNAELNIDQITELAEEAYTYGLGPIVYHRLYTEQVIGDNAPLKVNVITHRRALATHIERGGQAPNHDTLYSLTWLDVGNEPLVIQIPDYKDRFYGIQLTSMYQENFQNIGNSMAYGNRDEYKKKYTFLLATEGWQGKAPKGIDIIRAPGPIVHFLQRTYVTPNDSADQAKANVLQDNHLVVPLNAWNSGSRKSIAVAPRLPKLVEKTDLDFYAGLNQLLNRYPPSKAIEKNYIQRFKVINIGNGKDFDVSKLTPQIRNAFLTGMNKAKEKVKALQKKGLGYDLNGWSFMDQRQGDYGEDYLLRGASVALGGIIPRPQFNTYALTFKDGNGKLFDGENNYTVHFDKDEIPQATAFWSMTVYGSDFYLPNLKDKRYKLSNLSPGIAYNKDGSLDMYFQHEAPSKDKFNNWLPIPKGVFFAVIRFYAPKKDVIEGKYLPPKIMPIEK